MQRGPWRSVCTSVFRTPLDMRSPSAMRPQSAKSKGRRHQQRICRDLLEAFPDELSADDVRSTSMGAGGEDVLLSTRAQQLIPYSFEAKCCERLNLWSAIEQAQANCPAHRTPCVVVGKNRTLPFAVVPWEHFVSLIAPQRPEVTIHAQTHDANLEARLEAAGETIAEAIRMLRRDAVAQDAQP